MLQNFTNSIHKKKKVRITFYSNEDKKVISRIALPLDYAPSKNSKDKENKYHFWDITSKHPLSLNADKILKIEFLEDIFNPADYITWTPNWSVKRDWGKFS